MRDAELRDLQRRALEDDDAARRLAQEIVRTHGFSICRGCRAFVPVPDVDQHKLACSEVELTGAEQQALDALGPSALKDCYLRQQPFYDREWVEADGSTMTRFLTGDQPGFYSSHAPRLKQWGVDTNVFGRRHPYKLLATRMEVLVDPGGDPWWSEEFLAGCCFMLVNSNREECVLPGLLALRGQRLTKGGSALLLDDPLWHVRCLMHGAPRPPRRVGPAHSFMVVVHGVWITEPI